MIRIEYKFFESCKGKILYTIRKLVALFYGFIPLLFCNKQFCNAATLSKWNQQNTIYYRCMWNIHTHLQTRIETKSPSIKNAITTKMQIFVCVINFFMLDIKGVFTEEKLVKLIIINSSTAYACNLISDWSITISSVKFVSNIDLQG